MKHSLSLTLGLLLAGCASAPARPTVATTPSASLQWLYGSAEGSVATVQVFRAMTDIVVTKVKEAPRWSAIIDPNPSSDAIMPHTASFLPCRPDQPLAAVFDADETLIWNIGAMRHFAERGIGFDPKIWDAWEKSGTGKAIAAPGAIEALRNMRNVGVTIVVNSNRSAANAAETEATLAAAGLGDFKHGDTLFLMGDTPDGSGKDSRRFRIAEKYCVIAMAGDQLGDFADSFNDPSLSVSERRRRSWTPSLGFLWGRHWFLIPNPVYGPSIRGGFDDIFPSDKQWEPK